MGKRVLLNIWLAVALLVLVWVVWQEPGHAPKSPPVKLTSLSPAAINKLIITNHNGSIALAKQDGLWRLTQPFEIAANGVRVDDVLDVVKAESLSQFPAAGRDLSEYGLAKPAVRLRLNDTEIQFGGLTPIGQQRYVKLGDTIHLIADRYMIELTGDAAAWVNRNLVPSGKQIVALKLPDVKLTRDDKGKWSAEPASGNISEDAVKTLVHEWSDTQALRVAPYEKHADQGEVIIEITGATQPLRYHIIARKPELILARPEVGLQFYVASEQADRLLSLKMSKPAATATEKN